MLPTDVLKNEHRVIEQVLDCLEKIAEKAATQGQLDGASGADAVDFLRNFADRCHHGKEEHQLFPFLESKGFDRANGPTSVMCHEHEQGRGMIRGMAESIESNDAESFAGYARAYVEMLRVHIQKEDHCLFSMADRALSAAEQDYLMEQFEKVETEDMGEGTHERFLELANSLADKYGVARASVACGGGHAFTCSHSKHS